MANIIITPTGTSDDKGKIQNTINGLNSGDTIILNGNFLLKSAVTLKSNMTMQINGNIKLNGTDFDLINFSNQHDITITGPSTTLFGELIGLGATHGTSGWGIRMQGSNKGNKNITFRNLKCHDFRSSGIAINQLNGGGLIENCICNNNGLNGIGHGDTIGTKTINCYCEGNSDTGINYEDSWNFDAINNQCVNNARHNFQIEHGVNGKITGGVYSNGGGDGINIRNRASIPDQISENIEVINAAGNNNAKDGFLIISSNKIIVQNSVFGNNGNYGIYESSGDYNIIKNNDLRNNTQKAGFKITGSHTIATGNIVDGQTIKYRCSGSPDFQCIEDPNGPFNSLAECQAVCKTIVTKYKIFDIQSNTNKGTLILQDQLGEYNPIQACEYVCQKLKEI